MNILKFKLLIIVFASTFISSFAGNDSGYNIKIKLNGIKDSLCYLANYFGDKQYIKDSARSDASGIYVFKGTEKLPGGIYLFVFPGRKFFEMVVDKEQDFTMETDTGNAIKNMKIKGSVDNKLFYDYLNFVTEKGKEVEALKPIMSSKNKDSVKTAKAKIIVIDSLVVNYKLDYIKKHPETMLAKVFAAAEDPKIPEIPTLPNGRKDSTFAYRYYKSHVFDKVDFSDDRILRTPVFHGKLKQYIGAELTLQTPDSVIKEADYLVEKARSNKEMFKYVVWYITNTYENSNIMGMDAVFVHMVNNYYTKDQATWVDSVNLYKIQERARILEPILIGKPAPYVILQDTAGKWKSLYDVKAKYTLLFFWDPDCGHCQKTVPKLVDFYNKNKAKYDLEVFGANTAVEEEKWKKFIRDKDLKWPNVADIKTQNNFRHEYDVSSTPQLFLLDKDKKIIAKKLDVETLEQFLKHLNHEDANDPNKIFKQEPIDDHPFDK